MKKSFLKTSQAVACLLLLSIVSAPAKAEACTAPDAISVHCAQAPGSTLDSGDRLWVAFVQDQNLYVTLSGDAGSHWAEAVRVTPEQEEIEINGENRPKIIVQDQYVLLSWTTKTEGNHTGNIRFSRSVDGGRSFSAPVTVNDDGLLTSHRFDSMLLTESGHLYLVWLDKRALEAAAQLGKSYAGSAVFGAISTDYGASFSENFKIADNSCECCRIAVAPHGDDSMALVWRQLYEGARDHAIAVLNPDGELVYQNRASVDNWQINACPHHGPALAQASGSAGLLDEAGAYHVSWFSNSDTHKGVYYGRHTMSAGETDHLFQVDGSAGAGHPQLAESNGSVYLLWKQFNGKETTVQLIVSRDQGISWEEPRILARTSLASDHPQLLKGQDGLYLAWQTAAEGYLFQPVTDPIRPFTTDSFEEIQQRFSGQPFMVALWSTDCPPCLVELDLLGKLLSEMPDLPLVLISTDAIENRDTAMDFLLDYDLAGINSWMFADRFVERLRFSIDPQWYGELPRSYFYDSTHLAHAHSGTMTEAMVREWLQAAGI